MPVSVEQGDERNDLTTIPLDHAPYKYSRAFVIEARGRGVLDHPVEPDDDGSMGRDGASYCAV
jgi:hypothetical protein